jgi:hypothetical protein
MRMSSSPCSVPGAALMSATLLHCTALYDAPHFSVCVPGYGNMDNMQSCSICAAGSYAAQGSTGACTLCGAGTTSPAGSQSADACVCSEGYGTLTAGECAIW